METTGATTPDAPIPGEEALLTPAARSFLDYLHQMFEETRQALLAGRETRRGWAGSPPEPPAETSALRAGTWTVANAPHPDPIAPLPCVPCTSDAVGKARQAGSGPVFASLEDALSPSWENVISSHNILKGQHDVTVVPRGWHLPEPHVRVNGQEISATLFDFGLAFFHAASSFASDGGAVFHVALPKLEHYLEARLWHDIFVTSESIFALPMGTIRAVPLIETCFAACMVEEIIYELRDHVRAIAGDPVDYAFSALKNGVLHPPALDARIDDAAGKRGVPVVHLRGRGNPPLPSEDRAAISYQDILVNTGILVRYLSHWLSGEGVFAAPWGSCDTAVAELCRTTLWHWRQEGVTLAEGGKASAARMNGAIREVLAAIHNEVGAGTFRERKFAEAATIASDLILARKLPEWFTLPVYRRFFAGTG